MSPIACLHLKKVRSKSYVSAPTFWIYHFVFTIGVKMTTLDEAKYKMTVYLSDMSRNCNISFIFQQACTLQIFLRKKMQENWKWKLNLLCKNYGRAPSLTKISVWALDYREIPLSKSYFVILTQYCIGEYKLFTNPVLLISAFQNEIKIVSGILLLTFFLTHNK